MITDSDILTAYPSARGGTTVWEIEAYGTRLSDNVQPHTVTVAFHDNKCTEYGVTFHSTAEYKEPCVEVVPYSDTPDFSTIS